MGGFYGSIHFRTTDRDAILLLAGDLARERDGKMWCGPALDGWVSIYPSGSGQDPTLAEQAAARFAGEIFYVAVHDDDVFLYRYFREGALVDAYWSRPGYFGEESRGEQEKEVGAPDKFAHLIADVARVRRLLDEDASFEVERLIAFAELLGIPNAATSYEYLEQEEIEDIRGWKQFRHVPDRRAERSAAKRRRAAEHARLQKDGTLLFFVELDESALRRSSPIELQIHGMRTTIEIPSGGRDHPHPDGLHRVTAKQRSLEISGATNRTLRPSAGSDDGTAAFFRLQPLIPLLGELPTGRALHGLLQAVPEGRRVTAEAHLRRVIPKEPRNELQAMALIQLAQRHASTTLDLVHVDFSDDGSWMFCGTSTGLFVARWSEVLAVANEGVIPWTYSYEIPPHALVANPRHGYVYATVHDRAHDCVIFGGMDGRLRTMSLRDGSVEALCDVPDRAVVQWMAALDDRTLVTSSQRGFPAVGTKPEKPSVHAWDHALLRERRSSGAGPLDPPLPPHALEPVIAGDLGPSPYERVIAMLETFHQMAPDVVRLESYDGEWHHPATVKPWISYLLGHKFRATARFAVPTLQHMVLQFFCWPEQCVVATVSDPLGPGPALSLSSTRADGSSFVMTNQPDNGLDAPPERVVRHLATDAETLLARFLEQRPQGEWVAHPLEDLPSRYARTYARSREWRKERGFTEEEAARFWRIKAGG
jgi:hypothetical protein